MNARLQGAGSVAAVGILLLAVVPSNATPLPSGANDTQQTGQLIPPKCGVVGVGCFPFVAAVFGAMSDKPTRLYGHPSPKGFKFSAPSDVIFFHVRWTSWKPKRAKGTAELVDAAAGVCPDPYRFTFYHPMASDPPYFTRFKGRGIRYRFHADHWTLSRHVKSRVCD